MSVRIIQGDCREVLATLPAESVHCVLTSPPYYGLRAYKIRASIWGGDVLCHHQWDDEKAITKSGGTARSTLGDYNNGLTQETIEAKIERQMVVSSQGQFCRSCSAWRGCFGLEPTYQLYIQHCLEIFREVRRVLRPDGVGLLNLGDSFATGAGGVGDHPGGGARGQRWAGRPALGNSSKINGRQPIGPMTQPNRMPQPNLKPKDLMMIPARVAIALQEDGWWVRSQLPWLKANPMPESCEDRPGSGIEYFFLLAKSEHYYWDHVGVRRAMKQVSLTRLSQPNIFNQQGGEKDPKSGNRSHRKALNNQAERLVKHEKWKSRFDGWDEYDKALGRNFRNTDLFFDSLERPHGLICDADGEPLALDVPTSPYKEAHFATFGPNLIKPLIRGATSERGCCAKCGAPWRRQVEREFIPQDDVCEERGVRGADGQKPMDDSNSWEGFPRGTTNVQTLGWEPTCKCTDAIIKPCVILDPFFGSGTVGLVADQMQRDCIGIELGEEYVAMARRRIEQDAPLFVEAAE